MVLIDLKTAHIHEENHNKSQFTRHLRRYNIVRGEIGERKTRMTTSYCIVAKQNKQHTIEITRLF